MVHLLYIIVQALKHYNRNCKKMQLSSNSIHSSTFFHNCNNFSNSFLYGQQFFQRFLYENLCSFSCSVKAQCYVSNESIFFDCRFDIYDPVFTQQTYKFELDLSKAVVGYVVGQVQASDNDNGDGGVVVYELVSYSEYFSKLSSEIGPLVSNVLLRVSQCLLYRAVHVFFLQFFVNVDLKAPIPSAI